MPKPLEAVSEGTSGAETSRCMGQLDVTREWRNGHGGIPLDRY